MSTAHDLGCTRPAARRKADGSVINVECPVAIIDYNKFMGGVDKGDQFMKYYVVRMKSRKCYKYIFWFLFEVCVLNTFILSWYSPCNHPNAIHIFSSEH